MTSARLPTIGLIGAIGAGKSTAARCFAHRGGFVIDCDALGHRALDADTVRQAIVTRWGQGVLNDEGRVNRSALGKIVFGKSQEREALERIVFPVIGELAQAEIANAHSESRFVVLDAATLLEAGWANRCDRIVYIDAPRGQRIARLATRSGWDEAELQRRESAQLPPEVKQARAHATIVNDAGVPELQDRVDQLLKEWNEPLRLTPIVAPRTEDRT